MPRRRYHGGLASVSRPGSDPGSEPPADAVAMDHGCPRIQGAVRFRNLSGRHATTSELSTDSPATHAPATSGWTRCSGLARLAVPVFSPTAVESGRSHAAIPDRTRTAALTCAHECRCNCQSRWLCLQCQFGSPVRLTGVAVSPARERPHGDTRYASPL
jgi:hypothetical protein